jgi:hypothetical protein
MRFPLPYCSLYTLLAQQDCAKYPDVELEDSTVKLESYLLAVKQQ